MLVDVKYILIASLCALMLLVDVRYALNSLIKSEKTLFFFILLMILQYH